MQPDSLYSKILLIIVDKGVLALLLCLVGFWFNREIEQFKAHLSQQNQEAVDQRAEISKLEAEKRSLNTSLEKQKYDITIQFMEKQLSEFYWPILLRLQKDSAIWQKIPDLHLGSDQVPSDIGKEIEKRVILPNHEEVIKIIETKIHLAQADDHLSDLLQAYMRHVAIYQALRTSNRFNENPMHFKEPFPRELINAITTKTAQLQSRYNELVRISID